MAHLCLRSGFLAFAFVLWPSSTLSSVLALGHFHLVTLVNSLTKPLSGLEGGEGGGGRGAWVGEGNLAAVRVGVTSSEAALGAFQRSSG